MRKLASNVITIARKNIGYHEKQSNSQLDSFTANAGDRNFTKFARDLAEAGFFNASKQGFEWCAVFVNWCFWILCGKDREATEKILCQEGPYAAGCEWAADYFDRHGRLDHTPQLGDQAFFNNRDHTGIVSNVDGDDVWIIEGNSDNMVEENKYNLNSRGWRPVEFGHPLYDDEEDEYMKRYHSIEELPGYAKPVIQALIDCGALHGRTDGDLDLSEDMVRTIVILSKAK